MRIALVPLDSRPPSWQYPQRLAAIAGIELLLPPRELLGTLDAPGDQAKLLEWLMQAGRTAHAAVFSWDALVYGGLVQSRETGRPLFSMDKLKAGLATLDWNRCAGYCLSTIPRLGLSVRDQASRLKHEQVREFFIASGAAHTDPRQKAHFEKLKKQLGEETSQLLWLWRERNARVCERLLELSCELGMRQVHFAIEDNAPTGPHLEEADALRRAARALKRDHPRTRVTVFDGADEALCLLLARAVIDHRGAEPLRVNLQLHPATPGPQQYTGLYESQTLDAGLQFLASQLKLEYTKEAGVRWLVCHGKQPQPDVFAIDPHRTFDNPQLLPNRLEPGGPLMLADLCACNGANPRLVAKVAELLAKEGSVSNPQLLGVSGWNTNFNALGLSAACLRLGVGADLQQAPPAIDAAAAPQPIAPGSAAAVRQFALERLADDIVYQSISRPLVLACLKKYGSDAQNFSGASATIKADCLHIVQDAWAKWCTGPGKPVLAACGIGLEEAATLSYRFPWERAFECEVEVRTTAASH